MAPEGLGVRLGIKLGVRLGVRLGFVGRAFFIRRVIADRFSTFFFAIRVLSVELSPTCFCVFGLV